MKRLVVILLLASLAFAACSGDDGKAASDTTEDTTGAYGVQVASYDLAADAPQRFTVGVLGNDGGMVVGGSVQLSFRFLTRERTPSPMARTRPRPRPDSPRLATASRRRAAPNREKGNEGVGVYEANGVDFGKAGIWEVTVTGTVDGKPFAVPGSFEVAETTHVPNAGDTAPTTVNLLPGDPEAPAKAVDSRAEDNGTVPDPELHSVTVADAIGTGKPTLVVISTPVFCVSRFCGPITDTVSKIAGEYKDRANFVHIEVWRDFENAVLNKAAAEWIYPDPSTDGREPWVFLIDGHGTITQRWDNVANGASMRASLDRLLS